MNPQTASADWVRSSWIPVRSGQRTTWPELHNGRTSFALLPNRSSFNAAVVTLVRRLVEPFASALAMWSLCWN
ncbi:hypothetical protein V8C43DRAFT_202760 [Trichoderma afarasin]